MARTRAGQHKAKLAATHLVVDGSNIATEGRSTPSLAQLDDAVRSINDEYSVERVTVVVDATFGHRIDAKERADFDAAVNHGELITPPAGAIGRGDAFVLQIADKAHAAIFSNDSFQEFHGEYQWLFDEGRLIGGKPVAGVGWIFVLRTPVRGPTSRKAVRDAKASVKEPLAQPAAPSVAQAAKQQRARQPRKQPAKRAAKQAAKQPAKEAELAAALSTPAADADATRGARSRRRRGAPREPINEQLAYVSFVVDHPIGSVINAEVDRFSSHGAYVKIGSARAYVPLKAMGDPPPRRAREVMKLGETRAFLVDRFDPERRGIDLALVGAPSEETDSGARAAEAAALAAGIDKQRPTAEEAPVSPAVKKAARKKAAAKKTPARKAAAKKTTAKRAPARKATAARKTTAAKRAPARKATAKKAPARKTAAKKAPARKAAAKKAPARKAATRKAPARKAAAKKAPARKATAKRTTARKAPARKATAKRTTAKK